MDEMNITSAQYVHGPEGTNEIVKATIDGTEMYVPMDTGNRHYNEILRQSEAGTLTIADAD